MCIAIFKPADKSLDPAVLEQCWTSNSDGAGFMHVQDNNLVIEKGFMDYDKFLEAYDKVKDKKLVLHFRIRTHGKTDEENTHPFRIGDNLAFVHNGIISAIDTKSKPDYSDTFHFNEQILQQLWKSDHQFIRKPHFQKLIAGTIGYSKLIFMDNKERVTIINPEKGVWEDGIWYSNSSYELPKPRYKVPSGYNGGGKGTSLSPFLQDKRDAFAVGDRVWFKNNHWESAKKGTIRYFGMGQTVGVEEDDAPIYHEDKGITIVMLQNLSRIHVEEDYNLNQSFFKEGDWVEVLNDNFEVGEVVKVTDKMCLINYHDNDEPSKSKEKYVQKDNLKMFFRPSVLFGEETIQ